ncbi:alpha-L-arabinofuranosidase/ABC-type glycerol-3-phosphate transport system permease component [Microbacterium sp. SORGH_AS 505]|nr:alpha-L-arabinofuranosidase/ABC-type glycerol-3-phosphate transport system permease component [Microbacterium sp. SORGH_AS_0505]
MSALPTTASVSDEAHTTVTGIPSRKNRSAGRPRGRRRIGSHVLLIILAIYFVIPIWWLFVAATKDTGGLFSSSAFWFDQPGDFFTNIQGLFTHQGGIYWRWLGNSFLYAFVSGLGATVVAVLAGYGFAKYQFRGRGVVFGMILGSVMVPLTALVIPTFMLLSQYGLINTPWAVILPSLLNPFGVYLMRVYTQDAVPDELLEAARIDGAGEWRTFRTIVVPLLPPGDRHGPAAVGRRHLEQLLPAAGCPHRPAAAARHGRPQPVVGAVERGRRRRAGLEPDHLGRLHLGPPAPAVVPVPAAVLAGRSRPRFGQVTAPYPSSSLETESISMPSARLTVDPAFAIGDVRRKLFGGFVEHLGRHVYDGIYEPGHESADAEGFRTDVIDLVKELGVDTIRYPGGNFVSGFRWEDSVGPVSERPRRLDLAWHSTETNEVGLHEFSSWLEKVGSDLMMAVNLGTRGTLEAIDLLEYSNIRSGTALSDRRIANGRTEPFGVRMWCLGNEMDGPWQLGHRSADDYGKIASQAAKGMRQLDPDIQLVVCGSSSAHMPTFGEWERVVLTHTYDDVDLISCHAYYEERNGDVDSFLASAVDMDGFIEKVVATADHVGAVRGSSKKIDISFDEWNVWYIDRFHGVDKIQGIDNWPVAPRLLEDSYSVLDAVVFGNLMISLLKHADRVASASLAQLVNVIAPIMTEPGGPAWRQTTFFPFSITSRLAKGAALRVKLESPTHTTAVYGEVPLVDAVATHDAEAGRSALFLVNRSTTESIEVSVDVAALGDLSVLETHTLTDDDINAKNTLADRERVAPRPNESVRVEDGILTITLPPVSWTAVALG